MVPGSPTARPKCRTDDQPLSKASHVHSSDSTASGVISYQQSANGTLGVPEGVVTGGLDGVCPVGHNGPSIVERWLTSTACAMMVKDLRGRDG